MPSKQSAEKAARTAQKRAERNKPIRSSVKTYITKARKLIQSSDLDAAQKAVRRATQALDKAAQKGVIHPNNAARRKSRLMKKLNQALAASGEHVAQKVQEVQEVQEAQEA